MEKFKWVKIEELKVELDSYQGPPLVQIITLLQPSLW